MSNNEIPIIGQNGHVDGVRVIGEEAEATGVNILTGKPQRKALFFESVTEVRCPTTKAKIRIWRTESELPEYADLELLDIFNRIPGGAEMKAMIDIVSSYERVTAVELTDANGMGCVAYFEW